MKENLKKFLASKTFFFLLLLLAIATAALFLGKLAADQWSDLVKWIGGYGVARGTTPHINTLITEKKREIQTAVSGRSDADLVADVSSRTS